MSLVVQDLEAKILGVTDDVTTCFCCGKSNLKRTVVFRVKDESKEMESDTSAFGGFRFLGTQCATLVFAAARKKLDKSNIGRKIKMQDIIDIELTADFQGKQVKLTYLWSCKAVIMTAVNGTVMNNLDIEDIERYWNRLQWQGNVELFIEKVKASYEGINLF